MKRWTPADLAKIQKQRAKSVKAPEEKPVPTSKQVKVPKPSKYKNIRALVDDIWFDSKLEASRYKELVLLMRAGKVKFFARQPVFDLGGGVIYRGDFMVVWLEELVDEERTTVEDTKGFHDQASKNKIKQVKARFGVDVVLVRSVSI